jgi:hypothetical protein
MATAGDTNNPQAPQSALFATAAAVFVGVAWGAVMLFVFSFWMGSKYGVRYEGGRPIIIYTFFIAGVAAAALAIWQAFTLWIQKVTPEQKSATLEKQRRIFSYVFLAAGLGLIILAFVLGIDKKTGDNYGFKLENFAEAFGALLFGLIALCSGYALQQPLTSNASPIQFLLDKVPVMKLGLIIIGVLSLVTFGYLFSVNGPWAAEAQRTEFTAYFPEYASLVFMSVLCLGCVLWLNTGQFDEFGIRLFVLIFGGSTGVILFFETLGRAYLWRQDIFLGGTAAWQGDNAWHFWLCAYLMFVSLVLMFASFNLARADIRKHVALRRVMYGYDTVVQGLLLIGVLAILNVVIYALVPFSFDWTQSRGAYALAEASKNLIAKLPKETNIIVLLPQGHPVYKDTRNLMDNCEAIGNKLKVQYLSPDANPIEYETLARTFPVIEPDVGERRGVLIVYGPLPGATAKEHNTPHTFVEWRKLIDNQRPRTRDEKPKYSYKGESEILKELKFLVDAKKKRKIYALQGNGEPDIKNPTDVQRIDFSSGFDKVGLGYLVEKLNLDNYEVLGLNFGVENPKAKTPPDIVFAKEGADKKKNVPTDCDTLIVAGSKDLSTEIHDAIERYMDRNGKMLVFLDVVVDEKYTALKNSGLESLLKRYGVEVSPNEFLLRVPDLRILDATTFLAAPPGKTEHPLASRFIRNRIIMRRSARIVRPAEMPGRYKAETVLQLDPPSGGIAGQLVQEKDVSVLKDPFAYMIGLAEEPVRLFGKVSEKPVSVAVAVKDADADKPRMVVFGDTDFITNVDLARSQTATTNYNFFVSAIEWMAEREGIGAQPKDHKVYQLDEGVNFTRMVFLPAWLMMLTLTVTGVSLWVVRRR